MADKSFPDLTMVIQTMPPELREPMQRWWQAFKVYMMTNLFTQGNIRIMTDGKGVVMPSPDGQLWLVTVDNGGAVSVDPFTP